jgi:hypothetical protein
MRAQLGEYRTYEQAQLGKQGDAAAIADYDKRMADTYRRIVDAKKQYDAIDAASLPEETALEQKIESGLKTYFGAHQRIAEAIAADDFDTARKVSGSDSWISRRDLFDALKQLSGLNAAQLDKNVATSKQAYRRTLTLFVIALSALVVVAAALGWIISRAIARPLTEATQAARDCGRQARRCAPGRRQGRDRRPAAFDAGHARRAAALRRAKASAWPACMPPARTSATACRRTSRHLQRAGGRHQQDGLRAPGRHRRCHRRAQRIRRRRPAPRRAAPARPARDPARVDGRGQGQPGGDARRHPACPKRPPTATSRCARMPASSSIRSAKW